MTGVLESPREAASAAYARHDWREAYDRYAEADAAGALSPTDLVSYAEAAWWLGMPDLAQRLRERTYKALVDAGDRRAAAFVAVSLFQDNGIRRQEGQAMAWLARAERLVQDDQDSAAYGRTRLAHAMIARDQGDPDAALKDSRLAVDLGTKHGDRDLVAAALTVEGTVLVSSGKIREGRALVDEATVAAVSGELSLFNTGWVYCNAISMYRDLADFRSASEWTEAARRWCDRQSVTGFPGICRVHRADILALRGALARAEQEARLATDEVSRFEIRWVIGEGLYEIGDIRLRMGDLPAAEEAFHQAHEQGRVPEPGLSLLRLAEGKAAAANASLRRALA
ncbi:MAG TPA: hypothetical protein VJQ09_07230, partial [Candidatus Limnocylindria bacterium]|nr:hypothetical protein [Candidatus Limnocylindria bacterium]